MKSAPLIVIMIVVISILFAASNLKTMGASGDIYINPDGSITPSTAPIQQSGNLYTFIDNIVGRIVVNRSDIIIDGDYHTLSWGITDFCQGFYVNVKNVTIRNTNIQGFDVAMAPNVAAIVLWTSASNITIHDNNMTDCRQGIQIAGGAGTLLNNTIYGNYISGNTCGIGCAGGGNNITGNTIENSQYPILLQGGGNVFFHNNFVDYTSPVYFQGGYSNSWNKAFPYGGNYWSDYEKKYPNASEVGSSRIWDTPYVISPNTDVDAYPLMAPTKPVVRVFKTNSLEVKVLSNSSISGFEFNITLRELRLNATGSSGTTGFCDIAIPDELLWGDFLVYLDDSLLTDGEDYSRTYNGTHNIFHLEYVHSTHTVKVTSTRAISEFSSLLILPLFIVSTLLVVIVYRKKRIVIK